MIWLGFEKEPDAHLATLLEKNYATCVGECDFGTTMIALGRQLECFPPKVFSNLPMHVLEEMTEVTDYPVQPESGEEILTKTRRRLREASEGLEVGAISEGKTQLSLLCGEDIEGGDVVTMTKAERRARVWKLHRQVIDLKEKLLRDGGETTKQEFSQVHEIFEKAAGLKPYMHEIYYNWGIVLQDEAGVAEWGCCALKAGRGPGQSTAS